MAIGKAPHFQETGGEGGACTCLKVGAVGSEKFEEQKKKYLPYLHLTGILSSSPRNASVLICTSGNDNKEQKRKHRRGNSFVGISFIISHTTMFLCP